MEKEPHKDKRWVWRGLILVIVALVLAAVLFSFRKYFHRSNSSVADTSQVVDKYANALSIAMQFFDVQKSGKLVNNKIAWRGDSAMGDGSEVNLDLSRGMYDAGDHVKFGFPMAFTATVLSWAILEYGNHMNMVNELESAQESLKWITDFLINAHPSENVMYIQVGDPKLDHTCWERPEAMTGKRPLTQVNASYPGTDVAAESAAAMAAASLVFKSINSAYSRTLLKHAKQLFKFADTYRGSYSISIPKVQEFYNSTGFGDELLWAAAWIYHATEDKSYLRYVATNGNMFANWGNPSWFSWENKLAGVQVLLSRVNFFGSNKDISTEASLSLQLYRQTAETFLCGLLPESPESTSQRTADGLVWVDQWNPLQYSVASSFLAVVYSDYMLSSQTSNLYCNGKLYEPTELRNFAVSQLDYILGDNPMEMSYLVGYGSRYPQQVHHRGASIPVDANSNCSDGFKWLHTRHPNPNVAVGALVGGPSLSDTYTDSRNNTKESEPTTYNSALLVGLISSLITSSSQVESFVKN
ncbi:endoglucanase 2-like [Lycium ferocissimum]|uniref:endoglucanase 2-like n=1 Tax=Lycium ferocissimum TaxID=112874 RepID=UPI002815B62C|nr:endoglucanase 2-like [Lycium ferocissimum]